MKCVAVIGAGGGMGATTTAAQLAAGLAAQHRPVLAFDFCPENLLRLHFGMPWDDDAGFATELLAERDWHAAACRSAGHIDFVPFGQIDSDAELSLLAERFAREPAWLGEQLLTLDLPQDTIVVCDCPRAPAALRAQVLARADLVLIVTLPDPVSYAIATRMTQKVARHGGPPTMVVLNCFDPSRRLDRDISVLLRTAFRSHLAPVLIHRDESLREALACKRTVFDFAPSSAAAHDFTALATWTMARLGHFAEAA